MMVCQSPTQAYFTKWTLVGGYDTYMFITYTYICMCIYIYTYIMPSRGAPNHESQIVDGV